MLYLHIKKFKIKSKNKMNEVKFDKNHSKEFIIELRKSVDEYFKKIIKQDLVI